MDGFIRALVSVWTDSGFASLTIENIIMILVGLVLLYLAIAKDYEPLLLLPIAFGCIMANFPNTGFETDMGVMMAIGFGIKYEIFPPLIFMGVGAMTDFGPLIANPMTMLLGAAAQIGVFVALAGAMALGFNVQEAASIGIIGGADGPTAIYLTTKLAPHLLGAIAVAAYSYMSLVPLIQPPIMKLCTTKAQRSIKMVNLRPVTRFEKVVFPIVVAIVVSLLLPPVAALMGCLCLGNLFEVSGVTARLSDTAQNALCNIVTIFLATGTGLTMTGDKFLNVRTLEIIFLGLVAFAAGTAGGVLFGQIMRIATGIQGKPADRFRRRICSSNGSSCISDRWSERQPVQLPADAGNGPERSRRYRYCSCCRHHARTVWILIRTGFKEAECFLLKRSLGNPILSLPWRRGRGIIPFSKISSKIL
jgi:oxaloacetate decarboxylase beta subunit/glutaconyl-CoA decarboxylase